MLDFASLLFYIGRLSGLVNALKCVITLNTMITYIFIMRKHFHHDNRNPTFDVISTILKKSVNILLLALYTLGTFCLPMGDFSMLKDLPEMYRHCKATEDKDLNVLEFLTEHVSPIGQLMEEVEHEKEEDGDKPREPIQSPNCKQITTFFITQFAFPITQSYHIKVNHLTPTDTFFTSNYISKIFRPPIVA